TAWRGEAGGFQSIAAYQTRDPGVNLTGSDAPEHLPAMPLAAGYFNVFGARVALGRAFSNDDDRPRGPRVVVLSHGLWVRRFGSDRSLIGRAIHLGGEGYEVIGGLGAEFQT